MNIQPFLNKVQTHITTRVVVDQFELTINARVRQFVKWWFDLIKNGIVVVALKVLSDRSDSLFISTIYFVSYCFFVVFCMSYGQGIYYYPFGAQRNNRVRFVLSMLIGVLVIGLATLGLSLTSGLILRAIEVAQTGPTLQKPH